MDNNMQGDNKNGGHWDKPWHHHGYYGHGHNVLRILLGILILLIVFWLGMEVGRSHGGYEGYGRHHGNMPYYYGGMMYEGPGMGVQKMMPGAPVTQTPAPTNTAPANK